MNKGRSTIRGNQFTQSIDINNPQIRPCCSSIVPNAFLTVTVPYCFSYSCFCLYYFCPISRLWEFSVNEVGQTQCGQKMPGILGATTCSSQGCWIKILNTFWGIFPIENGNFPWSRVWRKTCLIYFPPCWWYVTKDIFFTVDFKVSSMYNCTIYRVQY